MSPMDPKHLRDGHCPDEAHDSDAIAWQPIDLLLNQGSADEVSAMRDEVANDPMLALEIADTVGVIEQFRRLRTEASPEFAGKLQNVAVHAERFYRSHYQPKSPMWHMPTVMSVAAAATFFLLWSFDAGRRLRDSHSDEIAAAKALTGLGELAELDSGPHRLAQEVPITAEQASWEQAVVEITRRLDRETTDHMRDAFQSGIADASDLLTQWIDPSNTLTLLRLEHELRANAEVRAEALRSHGSLEEVDDRVQELADDVAVALMQMVTGRAPATTIDLEADRRELSEIAMGVRALIAAGPAANRAAALRLSGDWLAQRLPSLQGERLVIALSGLLELAAINGQHFDEVAVHGQRLVDEVLKPDEERWRRSLPDLVTSRVAAGSIGEAGRILSRLPAFGLDPAPCKLVRLLLLGQLRERRSLHDDRPEVLAAMLYGCGDLLSSESNERERVSWALRRWKPRRLAPDFATVQQIAWAQTPGSRGYTRLQGELRQLAVLPTPDELRNCAAFCLCLATNFAGHVGDLLPAVGQSVPSR